VEGLPFFPDELNVEVVPFLTTVQAPRNQEKATLLGRARTTGFEIRPFLKSSSRDENPVSEDVDAVSSLFKCGALPPPLLASLMNARPNKPCSPIQIKSLIEGYCLLRDC